MQKLGEQVQLTANEVQYYGSGTGQQRATIGKPQTKNEDQIIVGERKERVRKEQKYQIINRKIQGKHTEGVLPPSGQVQTGVQAASVKHDCIIPD